MAEKSKKTSEIKHACIAEYCEKCGQDHCKCTPCEMLDKHPITHKDKGKKKQRNKAIQATLVFQLNLASGYQSTLNHASEGITRKYGRLLVGNIDATVAPNAGCITICMSVKAENEIHAREIQTNMMNSFRRVRFKIL